MDYKFYCQNWAESVKAKLNVTIELIDQPNFDFKVDEIVGFNFNNNIAHIKGFYEDKMFGVTAILGGLYNSKHESIVIDLLRKTTDKEKEAFHQFADVEGNPIDGKYTLMVK